MIYLHKLIPLLMSPLVLFLMTLFLGFAMRSRALKTAAVVLILLASSPLVGRQATAFLERDYKIGDMTSLPDADAVIVLSGMVMPVETGEGRYKYEYGGAVDRLFAGVDIVKSRAVKQLVFTRGQLPWAKGQPEGEVLKARAISMGVSEEIIRLTPPVENTEGEAKAISAMLGPDQREVILITSAFHMPRAVRIFQAQGLQVTPYAVDFHATADAVTPMDLIPSAGALNETTMLVREMLGRIFYALKYAIK